MTNLKRLVVSAVLALAGIGLTHQLEQHQATAADTQTLNIRFQAKVGNQPFSCNASYLLGNPASQVAPLDFRFYISDVKLIDVNGNAVPLTLTQDGQWQHDTVALLDFEDKSGGCVNGTVETNDQIVGAVPVGIYKGIQYTLGVPSALNHADATLAASPLNLTSLWWNWQAGYKFARIDLSQQQMGASPMPSPNSGHSANKHGSESNLGFAIHLGSTGCQMSEAGQPANCSNPNRATITLSEFEPNQNVIVADLAALVANTNLDMNHPDTAPGCMSQPNDPDCAGIMAALGIPFNGISASTQTFFRLE